MSNNYTLRFQNNSNMPGSICVFQSDPNTSDPSVMSLAWFSKFCTPLTHIVFNWTIDYSFVWSETGQLIPGVLFDASQIFPADLNKTNQITLSKVNGMAYNFSNQQKGAIDGTLYVKEDGTIPAVPEASVGIGMSGSGTFVVQARPNLTVSFTPKPKYWVTFGNYTQGQVLDINEITDKQEVKFPAGVYSMTVILDEMNQWTVVPTSQVSASYLLKNK